MERILRRIAFLMVLTLPFLVHAQTVYEVKSHSIMIEGTSNLHDWTADVQKLFGNISIKIEDGKIKEVEKLSLKIDAESLKGSRTGMDSRIYDALNTKRHPSITFDLRKVNSISENPGTFRLNTSGMLSVSGVSKPVTLNAVGKVLPNGDIEFSGSTKLKMTDFNVSPPRAMFGALTTGDEVSLNYTIVVTPNILSDK